MQIRTSKMIQPERVRERLPGCLSPIFQAEDRLFEALPIQARPFKLQTHNQPLQNLQDHKHVIEEDNIIDKANKHIDSQLSTAQVQTAKSKGIEPNVNKKSLNPHNREPI